MKRRGLSATDLVMMGYGSIIGAGLFVASGTAVQRTGPSVVLAFAIGAVAFAGVLSALAEMASGNPTHGGLRTYARAALGPWMGFSVGWMYWASGVLTMTAEVTAAALLARQWIPYVPLWVFSLLFAAAITAVNFMDARGFGRVEGALAGVKVLALVLFVVIGGYLAATGRAAGLHALRSGGVSGAAMLFPTGARGFFASLLMVMVTYAGVQVVAMAAAETEDPPRTIPRTITGLTGSVVALYVGAFTVLVLLLPFREIDPAASPFVQALSRVGVPGVNLVLNLVIMTAALSALNSSLFSVSRMLRALADDGEAPRLFLRTTSAGLPGWALGASSLMLSLGVLLSYLLPRQVYLLVTSASGASAMFNWTVVAVSHLRYRRSLEQMNPNGLPFRAWAFPYLSLSTVLISLVVFATAVLDRTQRTGVLVFVTEFTAVSLVYVLLRWVRSSRPAQVDVYAPEPAAEPVTGWLPLEPHVNMVDVTGVEPGALQAGVGAEDQFDLPSRLE